MSTLTIYLARLIDLSAVSLAAGNLVLPPSVMRVRAREPREKISEKRRTPL
jgi:hypothetical protein